MAETALADVFVELADTLVDDFDVMDFLHVLTQRCVEVLGISAAGLLLADGQGTLQAVVASSERTHLLELFQIQTDQGPCLDCFASGQPVFEPDLRSTNRWPRFTAAANEVGFAAVHAVPMRLRNEIIGALNFFTVEPGALDGSIVRLGQAMADVATIGLLQQRAIHHRDSLTEQLQTALNSRIVIEQAKGILAERLQVNLDQAFFLLRQGARSHNRRLSDLAYAIVVGADPALPALIISGRGPAAGSLPPSIPPAGASLTMVTKSAGRANTNAPVERGLMGSAWALSPPGSAPSRRQWPVPARTVVGSARGPRHEAH